MPYILTRRGDIPTGTLQVLDLLPNTSQRRFPYLNPGQTKYVRNVLAEGSDAPRLTGAGPILTAEDSEGLVAWLLANVSDGSGTAATGSITTVAQANLLDGETVVISDGTTSVTFEFKVTATYAVPSPNVAVDVSADTTADDVRDTLIGAINGVDNFDITAADGGAATVDLTNDNPNLAPADANTAITETVADGGFAVSGMSGATASDALTATEASTDADDILAIVTAGTALDLATVNAALTTGALAASQHSDLMDLLAGRRYLVPAGTQIEDGSNDFAVVFPTGEDSGFVDGTLRNLYSTGALRISVGEGNLSRYLSTDFNFLDTTGPAVAVYEDDGTLFTP